MRCPDCNKFVGFDTDQDPEVESVDVEIDGRVTAQVRIVNACAECGQELTEATLELEGTVDVDALTAHRDKCKDDLSASEGDGTRTERTQTHTRNGRPLTGPMRYRKRYYGAEVSVEVECGCGEYSETVTVSGDVQASAMDSLV